MLQSLRLQRVGHNFATEQQHEYIILDAMEKHEQSFWQIQLSVQFSRSVRSDSLQPHGLQHARSPCPSPIPRVYSNSYPLSRWFHPVISSSLIPFSSCLQSFPASGLFKWVSSLHHYILIDWLISHFALFPTPGSVLSAWLNPQHNAWDEYRQINQIPYYYY